MKKFDSNFAQQEKNENSSMFNFANENKMEVLNHYEMTQIKGGDGEDDKNASSDWK